MVQDGNAVRPKPPTTATKKRKVPMHPFAPTPHRNLLDEIKTCKRFKTIQSTFSKRSIKQEPTSNSEDDPSGSSGAEIKGDSNYELPTDDNK